MEQGNHADRGDVSQISGVRQQIGNVLVGFFCVHSRLGIVDDVVLALMRLRSRRRPSTALDRAARWGGSGAGLLTPPSIPA